MKKSLHSFIEKTAISRDANEFLLCYSRVESSKFLLLIVSLKTEEELAQLCIQIDDLLALDLKPTLWLHPQCSSEDVRSGIFSRYLNHGIIWDRSEESDWEVCLGMDLKERSFLKIVWSGGALRNLDGDIVSQVHLSHDKVDWDEGSARAIKWVRPVLESQGPSAALQCVEPGLVMSELFTRKGSGSLVSQGYFFDWKAIEDIDQKRMLRLIESGFGKKLKKNYFSDLPPDTRVLLEREYRGGAILLSAPGFTYVDKVVVEPEFLGRGMGSLLLDELMENLQRPGEKGLAWRARLDNPYLGRYAQVVHGQAQNHPLECGTTSDGVYIYHYLGVAPEELREIVHWMSKHCSSFVVD